MNYADAPAASGAGAGAASLPDEYHSAVADRLFIDAVAGDKRAPVVVVRLGTFPFRSADGHGRALGPDLARRRISNEHAGAVRKRSLARELVAAAPRPVGLEP